MLASDQYVLYGLAVLAGTAVALARERSAAGPEVAILDHALLWAK